MAFIKVRTCMSAVNTYVPNKRHSEAGLLCDNCKGSRPHLYVLFKNISIGNHDIVITKCAVCKGIPLCMTDLILAFLPNAAASPLSFDSTGPHPPSEAELLHLPQGHTATPSSRVFQAGVLRHEFSWAARQLQRHDKPVCLPLLGPACQRAVLTQALLCGGRSWGRGTGGGY